MSKPIISTLCAIAAASVTLCAGCVWSSHPVEPAPLGQLREGRELEALLAQPGPLEVDTITAAEWAVPRSGLINLDAEQAKHAGLEDGPEPIAIYFHALRHPSQGLFIIDTGVERALLADPDNSAVRGLVRSVSGLEEMRVHVDLASWLSRQEQALAGVFLTHLHLDHILGLPDVPKGTPLYAGPGETSARAFMHLFVRGTVDRELAGHGALREWPAVAAGRDFSSSAVIDIFGDGSLWALPVPGHTPGSTAYLARTADGPVLFTGDACHTAFGWEHHVEPGTFSADLPESRQSLEKLEDLVLRHPQIAVRLGHQALHTTLDADPQARSTARRAQ